MNKKVKLNGVCELCGKQDGDEYRISLTADNDEGSPQKLSWDVRLPLPLHSTGRIKGEKTLYPGKSNAEILLSKRLAELSGNRARNAMSEPITATVTLGSKTATIDTTWSELFGK